MTPVDRGAAPFAVAAVLAGVLAANLVPRAPVGAGVAITALALFVAAALARRGSPRSPRAWLLGALALALAAVAAVRDAGWVVGVELGAALALGSIAMSSARGWRATARAAVAAPLLMPLGAVRVAGAAAGAVPGGSTGHAFAVGRGVLLAGALVALFGVLFASGDRAFARLADDIIPSGVALGDVPLRLVVFGLVVSLAGGLAQAARVGERAARGPLLRLGRIEWSLALAALNVLFALFVAVQLAVLFGGDGYVRETANMTYAEYARSGFAQLAVVGVLTLGVVAAALRWARIESGRQERALRGLLAVLCALTLVVLASALHRLGLYEEAFGFTRTRYAAHAFLLFDAALFALVLAALASGRRGWLAQATVVLSGLAALAFWVSDPDRRIAERNVERYTTTGRIDAAYLARLSADAVPALAKLPPALRARVLRPQRERLARRRDGLAGANVARSRAREVLAARTPR